MEHGKQAAKAAMMPDPNGPDCPDTNVTATPGG